MSRYSIEQFVQETRQQDRGQGLFELENDRMLEVNLNGQIWCKTGAMVAYVGQVKFEREGILEKGVGRLLKKAITGEGTKLTKATGQGQVYLADSGKTIQILQLNNESLFVNGNDLLAFEPQIDWDIKVMRKLTAVVAGGLFNVRLEGSGHVAISTHFEPLTLICRKGYPIRTDPNATVAWSGNLQPEFKIEASLKSFFGRGSGESFQMEFDGDGFVVVQPYEEVPFQAGAAGG
ncbi:MAG TPA: hypothetical protein DCQ98_05185 [Planctomycetaceae bacterium]|nr:hypothetical protein [Planctomycetaceae bacterium]HRF01759.1 AIM24 family protein [Pirellulaceae bacterium]